MYVPSHLTPASSEWVQSDAPIAASGMRGHSKRLLSFPLHTKSSSRMLRIRSGRGPWKDFLTGIDVEASGQESIMTKQCFHTKVRFYRVDEMKICPSIVT